MKNDISLVRSVQSKPVQEPQKTSELDKTYLSALKSNNQTVVSTVESSSVKSMIAPEGHQKNKLTLAIESIISKDLGRAGSGEPRLQDTDTSLRSFGHPEGALSSNQDLHNRETPQSFNGLVNPLRANGPLEDNPNFQQHEPVRQDRMVIESDSFMPASYHLDPFIMPTDTAPSDISTSDSTVSSENSDVEMKYVFGESEIFDSLFEEGHRSLQYMIDAGVNPNIKDEHGNTLLQMAILSNDVDAMKIILDSPLIDVNQLGLKKTTALQTAILSEQIELVKIIIERPMLDVNQKGVSDQAALHIAASIGDVSVATLLLDNGANLHQKTKSGRTAADIANMEGHEFFSQTIGGSSVSFEDLPPLRELQRVFDIENTSVPRTSMFSNVQASHLETLESFKDTLPLDDQLLFGQVVEQFSEPIDINGDIDVENIYDDIKNGSVIRTHFSIPRHYLEAVLYERDDNLLVTFVDRSLIMNREEPVKAYEIPNTTEGLAKAINTVKQWSDLNNDTKTAGKNMRQDLKKLPFFSTYDRALGSFELKKFKTGICTYANPKTTQRVLLRKAFGQVKGDQVYKKLTTFSRVETANRLLGSPAKEGRYTTSQVTEKFPSLSKVDAKTIVDKVNSALAKRQSNI